MKTHIRIIAFILFLALCGLHWSNSLLFAQRGGGRGGQGMRGGQHSGFGSGGFRPAESDTAPFNITGDQLPPMYFGHNIQLIYRAIRERKTGIRDVTETTARLQGNGKSVIDSPPTGTLGLGSIYAFRIVPAENFYNSGEHLFQSYCPLSPVLTKGVEDKSRKGFRVDYSPQMDNHSTFTDATGKQIEIKEIKFRDFTIAFENFPQFTILKTELPSVKQAAEKKRKKGGAISYSDDVSEQEMIVGMFKQASAEAKQSRESVMLLAICSLVAPYVSSEAIHRTGTPEKPGEYLAQHEYLHVRLLELWFYDIATGKVLTKIKPNQDAR